MTFPVKNTTIIKMKKFCLIFLIIILLFTGCASPRPWTKQERIAAGYFLLAHSADAFTTRQLLTVNKENYEINPIMDKHPSDTEIGIYFSLTALTALGLSHFHPEFRKPLLVGYGSLNSFCVIHNYNLIKQD